MTLIMVSIPSFTNRKSDMDNTNASSSGWKMKEDKIEESGGPPGLELELELEPSDLDYFLDKMNMSTHELEADIGSNMGLVSDTVVDLNDDFEGDFTSALESLIDFENFPLDVGQQNQQVPESHESESLWSAVFSDHPYSQMGADLKDSLSSASGTLSRSSSTSQSLDAMEDSTLSLLSVAMDQAESLQQQQQQKVQSWQKVVSQLEGRGEDSAALAASRSKRGRGGKQTVPTRASPSPRARKWSTLNEREQIESIMALSDIINTQLGVRERLEAIRIINPKSMVSPTDEEFVLDTKSITNASFIKLQRFVRRHADDCGRKKPSPQKQPQQKKRGRGGRRDKKSSQQIMLNPLLKTEEQREREAKSGFFLHEVRMSVCNATPDDDDGEDLNILD
ncbi:uncharacterized protein LOC143286312 [Babylonia areolata]|uniref:uncharacterized protein LOC143286312 n=1 Tax=Babylonia areolata TaxID=304850 RepID=UPI003FD44580